MEVFSGNKCQKDDKRRRADSGNLSQVGNHETERSIMNVILISLIASFVLAVIWVVFVFRPEFFLTWCRPFMRGEALRNWAATTVEQLALNRMTAKRTGVAAVQLATEVEEGAVHAMMPLARKAELERIVECREKDQETFGVTAPEVLAIAADLSKKRSRAEQEQIHDLAVENAERISSREHGSSDLPSLPCPLLGEDRVCFAYAARPLHCRVRHAVSVAQGMGRRNVQVANSETEAPDTDQYEATIAQGMEIGLTQALKSAGLDARVYELNSALATALETADAADRWAKEGDVFATSRLQPNRLTPPLLFQMSANSGG